MKILKCLLLLVLAVVLTILAIYQFAPDWILRAEFARQRLVAGASERTVTVDDHQWSYLLAGRGEPMILVHGFSGSKENWLPVMPYLTDRYRIIAPDLPGWGQSSRIEGADYGVPAQAARLARFIEAIGVPRPVVVGHSMGGHISGLLAARHPEQLSALILVASAGVHFTENDFARRVLAGQTPFNASDRAQWHALMNLMFEQPPWMPPRVVDALVARNVANHAFHQQVLAAIKEGEAAFALERELPQITAPTTVIWCTADHILDASSVDSFRAQLPTAQVRLLPGCGHVPMIEVPDALAGALLSRPAGR